MKVTCVFDELKNFVQTTLVQIHTVLENSKVFLKYVFGCDWLLVYPLSLNFGLTKSLKSYMTTILGMSLPD